MTESFILAHGEEFIQCPYNTAHQITNSRMTTHLDKCRKAYLKSLTLEGQTKCMKICRFNAYHHVPAVELRFHEKRCTDSFSVVRHLEYHNSDEGNKMYEKRREQDRKSGWQQVQQHRPSSSSSSVMSGRPLAEEDWEADCAGNTPGYDPSIKLKSEVVIYNPPGLTKSERKKFRNEVRQKAAELSLKGEPVEFPTAADFSVKQDMLASLTINDKDEASPPETANAETYSDDEVDYRRPLSSSHSSKVSQKKAANSLRGAAALAVGKREDDPCDSDDFEGVDPFIKSVHL